MRDHLADFAAVYESLYGGDLASLEDQIRCLSGLIGPPPRLVLDVGCGTGRHLLPLSQLGYQMVGLDQSPGMLHVANKRTRNSLSPVELVLGDMRALPFCPGFTGALCLESPLAHLLDEAELDATLAGLHRVLQPASVLVVDILYDYVQSLGAKPAVSPASHFATPAGSLTVRERHAYDADERLWTMTQVITGYQEGRTSQFTVRHRLRVRSFDEYAAALERAGFVVRQAMPHYPAARPEDRAEPRIILSAERP